MRLYYNHVFISFYWAYIYMTFQKKEEMYSDSLGDFWKKIKRELEKIMEKEDLSE
jgi:hypothetical protein